MEQTGLCSHLTLAMASQPLEELHCFEMLTAEVSGFCPCQPATKGISRAEKERTRKETERSGGGEETSGEDMTYEQREKEFGQCLNQDFVALKLYHDRI